MEIIGHGRADSDPMIASSAVEKEGCNMANVVLLEPTPMKPPIKLRLSGYAPMGPLTVAAPLVAEGYSVKIIDQRLNRDWERDLLSSIDDETICVGVSTMTGPQLLYALRASEAVKRNSSVPVVWGGVHASLLPEQTVRHPWIDFVVQGEGDHALLALVWAIAEGHGDIEIPGVWSKRNGTVRATPPGPFADLDTLPRIPFHLIDAASYDLADILLMFTSRGCAHRCGFCYNLQYCGRRWRAMRPDRVMEDLNHYVGAFRPRRIFFRDDNFFQDPHRVREICRGIVAEGLKFRWRASCRVDYVSRMTDEEIDLMLASGFDEDFGFGMESGSQRVLDLMRKDLRVEEITEVVARLRKRGFLYTGTFVGGYPGETLEELEETLRFIGRLFREDPSFSFRFTPYRPYPGTTSYDCIRELGFRFPDTIEGWAHFISLSTRAIAGAVGRGSSYPVHTPWLSARHKRRVMQAALLAGVAGRPLFRSKSLVMRLLALPYNLPIRAARRRWVRGWWGPVPERHIHDAALYMGIRLFRCLVGRPPARSIDGR